MNNDMPEPMLLYLFFGVIGLAAAFEFVRTKTWRIVKPAEIWSSWRPIVLGVVPMTALLAAGKLIDVDSISCAPYFAGAASLAFVCSRLGFNTELRSTILLMCSVAVSIFTDTLLPTLGTAGGLLFWKAIENFLSDESPLMVQNVIPVKAAVRGNCLSDIAGSIVWLCTYYWSETCISESSTGTLYQGIVLATLIVAAVIRMLQRILLGSDPFYMKRVALSMAGGLGVLIVLAKILLNDKMDTIAMIACGGFFFSYVFQTLDRHRDEGPSLPQALSNVMLLGLMMLALMRLANMQGVLVMAAATTIIEESGTALIVGLFFASRALLQSYVVLHNSNVTGINLMHNYANAALYAGFLLALVASVLIRNASKRSSLTMIYLSMLCIVPAASNYFLHSEPTSSLLISLGVASVLITLLAPAVYPGHAVRQENVILTPLLAGCVALMCRDLLETGDGAATQDRLIALGVIGVVVTLIAVVSRFISSSGKPTAPEPPTINTTVDAPTC